jgi:hypothetical protein
VHEHILGAIIWLNEAEAFLGIEKFNSSDRHQEFPFTLPVERPRVHRVGGHKPSFGFHLRRSPKPGAWQQDEAENQVAGGDLDEFRCNVNGSPPHRRCQITFYEFVTAIR